LLSTLVASQPAHSATPGVLIGLRVEPTAQQLIALGSVEPITQGVMATAVYWPRPFCASHAEAAIRGHALQWQVNSTPDLANFPPNAGIKPWLARR